MSQSGELKLETTWSTQQTGPSRRDFLSQCPAPRGGVRNRAGPELRRSVTAYVPVPSLWHEPTISVPTKDSDPQKSLLPQQPDAEGDVHAGKREVPQSPQRPACRASLLPAAIPGALRDLAARSRLPVSPQGGRRQRDDLLTDRGGNGGGPRTPRGRAGGRVGKGRLPAPSGPPAGSSPGPAPRERALAAARRFPGRLKFEKVPVAGGAARSNGGGDPAGERRAEGSEGHQHGGRGGAGRGAPHLASGERAPRSWAAPSALWGFPLSSLRETAAPCSAGRPRPGEGGGSEGSGASRCVLRLSRWTRPGEVGEAVRSGWEPLKTSFFASRQWASGQVVAHGGNPLSASRGCGRRGGSWGWHTGAGGGQPASVLGKTFVSGISSPGWERCPALFPWGVSSPIWERRDGETGAECLLLPDRALPVSVPAGLAAFHPCQPLCNSELERRLAPDRVAIAFFQTLQWLFLIKGEWG